MLAPFTKKTVLGRVLAPALTLVAILATVASSGTLLNSTTNASLTWVYIVSHGDYLSRISPAAWRAVAQENSIHDPNRIFVGEYLYVDVKQVAPALRHFLVPRATLAALSASHIHSWSLMDEQRRLQASTRRNSSKNTPSASTHSAISAHQTNQSNQKGSNNQGAASSHDGGGSGSHQDGTPSGQSNVVNAVRTCYAAVNFSSVSQWSVPNSCYANIYYPNVSALPYRPSFGWCNWLPEESHLNYSGYGVLQLAKHWGAPRVGAVVWFNPGDQGAGGAGHWANLIAIGSNGWGLIEEMNFTWRGGGFGRIDYRYIRLYAPGTAYLYA